VTRTGWTGEPPEGSAPAMPLTERLLGMRGEPDVLGTSLARPRAAEARQVREEAAAAPDPDERAANLVIRGYAPGMISQLSQRLADTVAEIAAEEDKIEKAAKRAERTRRMHERGQIDAAGVAQRWRDTDEGDSRTVARLTRRAESLRRQIAEASEVIAPRAQRPADPFEQAAQRAHAAFAESVREKMAAAEAGRPGSRPFASVSRGVGDGHFDVPECGDCVAVGATAEESLLIHQDPQPLPVPDTLPATHCRGCGALLDWCTCAGVAGRYQPVRAGG
jgi:hypothetical protein